LGGLGPKDGKPASNDEQCRNNVDFLKPIGNGPLAHGFDHYFGVDVPNYPPYGFIENDRTVGVPSGPDGGREEGFNMPGPMIPGWRLVDILPQLTRHAERWIEDTANSDKPFFLYLPLTSPHYPVVPSPEFIGKSKAGEWVVGRVLDALDKAGVADETLVIFTSDNGPEITGEVDPGAYDRIRKFQHTSMGKLRGAKRDLWEGGHRVPFIARWPGRIAAGSTSDESICHVDLMATVAAQLGVSLPPDAGEDSYNILPVLLGENRTGAIREATVHHSASGTFAIRKGDWVFIQAPSGDDNRRNGEPDWFRQMRGYGSDKSEVGLFNLRDDPSQKVNLAAEHPSRVLELRELLEKYRREGRSTPGAPQANDAPMQRSTPLPRFRGKVKQMEK
jgi:arylsulfatase A